MEKLTPTIKIKNNQKGVVASIATMIILIFMLTVAMSVASLIFDRQRISTNTVVAIQSYYTAEAGIEDSLLRLKNNPLMSPLSYTLTIGNSSTNVVIPAIIGGSRSINSQGTNQGLVKTTQVVYSIDSQDVSFHYGAQVGAGGLQMSNGSSIQGNVYSNGNITGTGTINNDAIVANNGNSIASVRVNGNALTYSCTNATIDGNLTYVTGGTNTCTVGGTTSTQSGAIIPQPLPISQTQIDTWKSDAGSAQTINGNYTIGNNQTQTLGPVKITGDLNLGNGTTLNITGTIYVQGAINFGNTNIIRLDPSYNSLSGILLSDQDINTGNGSSLLGSGQASSYLLVLSTSASDSAITVSNNANGAIFYTSSGGIQINNNVSVREVTGYKLIMNNNATIQYQSGLANLLFTSGPGGSWKIKSWQEQ